MRSISSKLLLTSFLLSGTTLLFAQSNKGFQTSVNMQIGSFWVPASNMKSAIEPPVQMLGLDYTHRLNSRWFVSAAFHAWYNIRKISKFIPYDGNGYYYDWPPFENFYKGLITNRHDYHFADLGVNYTVLDWNQHRLDAGGGPSYAWGKNNQIVGFYREPGYPDLLLSSEIVRANYFGGYIRGRYRYSLANHINAGVYGTLRFYKDLPSEYDFGLTIGYDLNFRVKSK